MLIDIEKLYDHKTKTTDSIMMRPKVTAYTRDTRDRMGISLEILITNSTCVITMPTIVSTEDSRITLSEG